MSLVPINSAVLPGIDAVLWRGPVNRLSNGVAYGDVPFFSFVDLGDRVVINGVMYSPDLTQCFGAFSDPDGCMMVLAARKAAMSTYAKGASDSVDGVRYSIAKRAPRAKMYGFFDNGQRFFPGTWFRDEGSGSASGETAGTATFSAFSYNADGVKYISRGTNYANKGDSVVRHLGEIFVLAGNGSSQACDFYSQADGSFIRRVLGTSNNWNASWHPTGHFLKCSDGVVFMSTLTTAAHHVGLQGFTKTTQYWVQRPAAVSETTVIRPMVVPDSDTSFYTLQLGPSATNRYISRIVCPSATLAGLTETKTSADVSAFGFTIPATMPSAAGEAWDRHVTLEILTVNGTRYLVAFLHSMSMVGTNYNESQVVCWRIEADPNQLTFMFTKQMERCHGVLCSSNRVYMMTQNGVVQREFVGTDLLDVETFAVGNMINALILTEQDTVLAIDNRFGKIHNLSLGQSAIVNTRFRQGSVVLGQAATVDLLLDVTDGAGQRLARDVDLTIRGAVFADDTTTKRVSSLTTGTLAVPVKITSAGSVAVTPKLV